MTYGTLIQTVTLASTSTSISFSSIPQTFSDLVLVVSARTTDGAGAYQSATFSVNGATTSQSERYIYTTNTTINATTYTQFEAWPNGAGATANTFGSIYYYIPNYATSIAAKAFHWDIVAENNGTAWIGVVGSGTWSSSAAITSLALNANFAAGSTASLYGVNPIPAASLGTTPTVDAIVVAGGGGAGYDLSGGGGGGGVLPYSATAVSAGSAITVTVGAGGAGSGSGNGSSGQNSQFGTLTAAVGGSGGGTYNGGTSTAGPGGSSGNGYSGGTGAAGSGGSSAGGGGGGASAVGGNGVTSGTGGSGGAGLLSTYSGVNSYYGGGGGGGQRNITTAALGGIGGGGNGSTSVSPYSGNAGAYGTGGGAGGNGGTAAGSGKNGGSGAVIIRYPQTYNAPTTIVGNPVVNYVNGYRVYTWYNSGSITF